LQNRGNRHGIVDLARLGVSTRRPRQFNLCPNMNIAANPAATPDHQADPQDKDAPLKEDIRLLGRLLGDVLRNQDG
jgi:phosphoenolpyruvate carboxylase